MVQYLHFRILKIPLKVVKKSVSVHVQVQVQIEWVAAVPMNSMKSSRTRTTKSIKVCSCLIKRWLLHNKTIIFCLRHYEMCIHHHRVSPTQLQDQDLQPQEAAGYSAGIPLDPCSRNLAESATCSWSCSCWLQRRGGAESSWSLGVMGMVDVGCPTLWEPKDGQSDETMSNWVRVPPV